MVLKVAAVVAVAVASVWATVTAPFTEPAAPSPRAELWPGTEAWADSVLATLTVEQKVGQLFVTHAYGRESDAAGPEWERLRGLVETGAVGGVLFFAGESATQAAMTERLQAAAPVPLLISQDMENGPGMRLTDGTRFPKAMALGAARSPELAYLVGRATAAEARAIGVHQSYGPVADVNVNAQNPVINVRSFGADPALVGAVSSAAVRGLQDGGLIATAKHFPGHGDTSEDSHAELARVGGDRARLDAVELVPFQRAVDAGVMAVMTGHLAVPALDPTPGLPATLSRPVVTGVLRESLGFDGLVVTDGLDMRGVTDQFPIGEIAVRALEAGVDQLLLTRDEAAAGQAVRDALASGRLDESRLDASVRRILRAKAWAGLAGSPPAPRPDPAVQRRAQALAQAVAREAVTVVQPGGGPVPFVGEGAPQRVLTVVLDDGRDTDTGAPLVGALNARVADGGAATSRRLGLGDPQAAFDEVERLAREHDVVVAVTFSRVRTGTGELGLPDRHRAALSRLLAGRTPVVLAAFGSPYVGVGLPRADAFVAAYGTGEAEQQAVAEALWGEIRVSGRLPVPIPGLYELGDGETIRQQTLRTGTPTEAGLAPDAGQRIDRAVSRAVSRGAFPGAALAVGRAGVLVRLQGYGRLGQGGGVPTEATPYDLASVTKVLGTTAAVMRLVEQRRLRLDARVTDFFPEYAAMGKGDVTVRHLLTHSAGHRPWYPFHARGITDRDAVRRFIRADTLRYRPGTASRYSDFDFIVLGDIIEAVTGERLDRAFRDALFEPLGMTETGFRRVGQTDRRAAPTEFDGAWRGRMLQGEVHDEAASVLGGVAGHAGLFSTARDMARFGFALTNAGEANGTRLWGHRTFDTFLRRSRLRGNYPMALGWMLRPTDGAYSSSGTRFGPRSFGHTGFTGTSIWVDPDEDLFVVLLTNRVHPSRRRSGIKEARAEIADAVAGAIVAPADRPWWAFGFGTPPLDLPVFD